MTDPATLLRTHGLHVTAQRVAVLRALVKRPHGSAETIAEEVRAQIGAISQQAVYDALGTLSEKGLLRRIQPAGLPALFDLRARDRHHHAICRACGAVVDVECDPKKEPSLAAAAASGFTIDEAEVLYWGLCPACQPSATRNAEKKRR